jgi:hypothetical protein
VSFQNGRAYGYPSYMLAGVLLAILLLGDSVGAAAQDLTQFFELANPPRFDLRLFASGYGAEKYGTTHEGFEFSQTVMLGSSAFFNTSTLCATAMRLRSDKILDLEIGLLVAHCTDIYGTAQRQ